VEGKACVRRLRKKKKPKGRSSVLLAERGEEDGGTVWRRGLERLV
jgi:hypothetical protein